jgi:hypothetical protein
MTAAARPLAMGMASRAPTSTASGSILSSFFGFFRR